MAWYWPDVHTLKRAKIAARMGACLCFCFAVADAVLVVRGMDVIGASGAGASWLQPVRSNWSLSLPLLGCVLFTIAGGRIWNCSKTWAIIVFVWYVVQTVRILGMVLMLLFPPSLLLGFVLITAVRGCFAYDWLSKAHAEAAHAASAATANQP